MKFGPFAMTDGRHEILYSRAMIYFCINEKKDHDDAVVVWRCAVCDSFFSSFCTFDLEVIRIFDYGFSVLFVYYLIHGERMVYKGSVTL